MRRRRSDSARAHHLSSVQSARSVAAALLSVWTLSCGLPRGEAEKAPARMSVTQILGQGSTDEGFARADVPRDFDFPADHGAHREFRNEWWYWTGNLKDSAGHSFGYQLTFFRTALLPQKQALPRTSTMATSDVYMAHFALASAQSGSFQAAEKLSRAGGQLAGANALPFHVWIDDWSVTGETGTRTPATDTAVAGANVATPMDPIRLKADAGAFAVDLRLLPSKAIVLQGDAGRSLKGHAPGNASYYYSVPRLDTVGTVRVGAHAQETRVQGLSWMDREWSTSALEESQVGWDWLALHLDDGSDWMVFRLRTRAGQSDDTSSGMGIERDGTRNRLAANAFVLAPLGEWESPHSHIHYPAGFRLDVPAESLQLEVRPLLPDQELDVSFRYWEGSVEVRGKRSGKDVAGTGYLEMTGYLP